MMIDIFSSLISYSAVECGRNAITAMAINLFPIIGLSAVERKFEDICFFAADIQTIRRIYQLTLPKENQNAPHHLFHYIPSSLFFSSPVVPLSSHPSSPLMKYIYQLSSPFSSFTSSPVPMFTFYFSSSQTSYFFLSFQRVTQPLLPPF